MSCMIVTAPEITMATTEFMRCVLRERSPVIEQFPTQNQPLRVNWVVLTDDNGNRRLQMGWRADRGD